MATTSQDRKELLALSTPAVKRALKAAALKTNKVAVALGVAKPIAQNPAKKRAHSTANK